MHSAGGHLTRPHPPASAFWRTAPHVPSRGSQVNANLLDGGGNGTSSSSPSVDRPPLSPWGRRSSSSELWGYGDSGRGFAPPANSDDGNRVGSTAADGGEEAELPAVLKALVMQHRREAHQLFLNLEQNHVRAMPADQLAAALAKAFPSVVMSEEAKQMMLRCAAPTSLVETDAGRILSPTKGTRTSTGNASSQPSMWRVGRPERQGSQRLNNPAANHNPRHPGVHSGAASSAAAATSAALSTALATVSSPGGGSTAAAVTSHLLAASNATGQVEVYPAGGAAASFNPFGLVDVPKLWRRMHNFAAAERSGYIRRATSLAKVVEAHDGTSAATATDGTLSHHPTGSIIRSKGAPAWRAPKIAASAKPDRPASPSRSPPGGGLRGLDGRTLTANEVRRLEEANALRQYVAEMPKAH